MTALLIVDMQNDFMPGGTLAVPGADACVPIINRLMSECDLVLATQDWHPADHLSFAPNHPGKKVGDIVMVEGTAQILWPEHCVRNSHGAALVADLDQASISSIFYKGSDKHFDSYSAFFDNARRKSTGLADYLRSRRVKKIMVAGVAIDYCVLYTVIDAIDLGFKVTVVEDACRGINLQTGDVEQAFATMKALGAELIRSNLP
jgi:nicotinamidase/pyrazinamidase